MSNVKKQNTLFRFVSLRSPELSKKENQKDRFIIQETKTGIFYESIVDATNPEEIQALLSKTAQQYYAYKTEEELKRICREDFYSVAEWIAQNKFNLPIEETLEKIESLEELDLNSENSLWDQLFSQIISPSSLYVKEGIMHLLTLQNILKRKKEINDLHEFSSKLPTLAQAKIVIPPELFKREKAYLTNKGETPISTTRNSKSASVNENTAVPLLTKNKNYKQIPFKSSISPGPNLSIYYIHMHINIPDESFLFSDISYTITSNASITNVQKYVYDYSEDKKILHILFYTNNTNTISQKVSGTITFENKSEYSFDFEEKLLESSDYYLTLKEKESEKTPSGFGITQLGIADYKKVVSEVICYDPGEVSHIENIMAREYKERSTKKFHQTQASVTESSETETEKLADNTSTERFEIQSEIAKIIQEQKNASVNTNAHYSGKGGFSLDIGAGYATANSKEESNRQALTEAKEITQRAMERMVSKVKKEINTKVTDEFTEENKHGFDNRKGDHHVSGVYRFINAIYRNQIYNYGKRLMYEFIVPQPSKFHTLWLNSSQAENTNTLKKPVDPRECGLTNASILNKTNYKNWASLYTADIETYPEEELSIGESFSGSASGEVSRIEYFSGKDKIEIPEGYKAIKAYVTINAADNGDKGDGKGVLVNIGNTKVSETTKAALVNYSSEVFFNTKFEKYVPFSVTFANYFSGSITISVHCILSESAQSNWQIKTFNAIMDGYQNQLDAYNSKVSDFKAENETRLETNPLYYRQIEQTALQKNCISYLSDTIGDIGKKMYTGDTLGNYTVSISEDLDKYGNFAKFMEQAFEWDMMSYTLYPFYWGNKEEWGGLYQFDCNDPLFKSFMQAGLARVVVTVKPGFEDAVMHYMATGQIWKGGEIPIIGDPLYLSIVDELKEQEYVIEETWETVVPTSLIALQNSGVVIEGSGLPCFHKDEGKGSLVDNSKKIGDSDISTNEAEPPKATL